MDLKSQIISLLGAIEHGKYSNIALNEAFREKYYDRKERAFITEVFYGVIRKKIFLDHVISQKVKTLKKDWSKQLLRLSIYQITFMESDNKGVVWEAVELTKKKYGQVMGKFINGVLRSYLRDKDAIIADISAKRPDIWLSFPKWFYDKIRSDHKERYMDVLDSMKRTPYISFRVNRLKYDTASFEKLLTEKDINIIKKVDDVYYLDNGILLYSDEFKTGRIIVQDASSYLAAKSLSPDPGDTVLDACAAPGGKTAVLAELMNNQGKILSLDIYPHKIKLIQDNCKKLGITNVTSALLDAKKINMQGKKFNKILIDAPCSGYGVLSKKPESIYSKKAEDIGSISKLQYELIRSCHDVLENTGIMVYSTCTFTREENTDNISQILKEYPDLHTDVIEFPPNVNTIRDEIGGYFIDQHEDVLDGFYIVRLKKTE